MDLRLAVAPVAQACLQSPCDADRHIDRDVSRLGARLARAAYANYGELRRRVPAFKFVVADKAEPGSDSDARGTVVIFRGALRAGLDEKALAFLIAREMGHVIARHHDEKSATSILLAVLVQMFMPLTSLTGGVATLTGSTASFVGTELVTARNGENRIREANAIAFALLTQLGWPRRQVSASLAAYLRTLDGNAWSTGLRQSLESPPPARVPKTADAAARTGPA